MTKRNFNMTQLMLAGSLAILLGSNVQAADSVFGPNPAIPDKSEAILAELKAIRQLLEKTVRPAQAAEPAAPAPPTKAKLKIADGYILGKKDAPLTMVGYSDAQCPFCRKFHVGAFQEIKKNYIDTGKVRFIARDLPLEFHENALRAAVAARCAGDQGGFWNMRDTLVTNASKLTEDDILGYATGLHLDAAKFRTCLKSEKYKAAIEKEAYEAAALNISGTPSFVVGKTTAEGVDGSVIVGALPYEAFEAKFKELSRREN